MFLCLQPEVPMFVTWEFEVSDPTLAYLVTFDILKSSLYVRLEFISLEFLEFIYLIILLSRAVL